MGSTPEVAVAGSGILSSSTYFTPLVVFAISTARLFAVGVVRDNGVHNEGTEITETNEEENSLMG
jgi:hypothetical protein